MRGLGLFDIIAVGCDGIGSLGFFSGGCWFYDGYRRDGSEAGLGEEIIYLFLGVHDTIFTQHHPS